MVAAIVSDDYIQKLDLTGLACPLPLLKMKLALKGIEAGQSIAVAATDTGSWKDFHKFAEITSNELLSAVEEDGVYHYVIKKGS